MRVADREIRTRCSEPGCRAGATYVVENSHGETVGRFCVSHAKIRVERLDAAQSTVPTAWCRTCEKRVRRDSPECGHVSALEFTL